MKNIYEDQKIENYLYQTFDKWNMEISNGIYYIM